MTIGRVGKSKGVSFRHDEVPYRESYHEPAPQSTALGRESIVIPLILGAIAFGGAVCMLIGALLALSKPADARHYRTPTHRTHYVDARHYEAGPALTAEQAEEQLQDAIDDCRPILWTRPENAARAKAYRTRCMNDHHR